MSNDVVLSSCPEANRVARLTRCKQLLKRYNNPAVDFIWFADKQVITVSQNDPVYAPVGTKPSATHALNIQQVGYGVRCRVSNGYD